MLGFLRRHAGGRHSLGAAVTAIPSAPHRVAVPVPAPAVPVAAPAPALPTPRVELGFRDGTSALLEPASTQARALLELAEMLRGGPAPLGSSTEPRRPTPSE